MAYTASQLKQLIKNLFGVYSVGGTGVAIVNVVYQDLPDPNSFNLEMDDGTIIHVALSVRKPNPSS